jgi:predicted kinase
MRLVEVILSTYRHAEVRDGAVATAALRGVVEETLASLAAADMHFPRDETAELAAAMTGAFDRLTPLLLDRGRRGCVRRCHGDLHLRNITLLNGVPRLFDAIEFDESIATIDILYDLAFLLMDLWEKRLPAQASLVLNCYLWGSPDLRSELEGLATLPLFMSLRAAVRAKVEALRLVEVAHGPDAAGEDRRYFAYARSLMAVTPPRLVAIGGISGAGKSTIAARIAPHIGRAPGAVHLRSDIERKRMAGVAEHSRLPAEAYARPVTEQVFASLREQAALALAAGQSVVVDAVHRRPEERDLIAKVAATLNVPFAGIWLDAPIDTATERVTARRDDASDATAAIVVRQAAQPTGQISWARIDATGSVDDVVASVLAAIDTNGRDNRGGAR